MSNRAFARTFAVFGAILFLVRAPALSLAQPDLIPAGKALDYRVIDSDSGEELWRDTVWRTAGPPSQWSRAAYPDGDWTLSQCVQGNGADHPATRRLAVTVNAAGQAVESEFDTFDPAYYPFLHRPLPAQPMEPIACFTANGLDYAALQRGEETSLYLWLNEAIFFRLIFRITGRESISVPAGTFDALKVRVKVDMPSFFPNLPAWAANLLGVLVPDFYAWVAATDRGGFERGGFETVRQTGFATPRHKHTMRELVGISDPPILSATELDLLHAAGAAPTLPKAVVDNTGTFTVGDLRGRAEMTSAKTGAAELFVVRTRTSDGLTIEAHSLVNPSSAPRTAYTEQRTYAPGGGLVRRRHLEFRADAFPTGLNKDLPDDLYAGSFTLAEVFPALRPQSDAAVHLHVLGFDGQVNELAMWQAGGGASPVDGVAAIHLKLRPIVDLPLFLKPLRYFLIPTLDVYLQDGPPYRLLEFTGPLGPPGSAPAHFIADAQLQTPPPQAQFQAAP